MPSTILRWVGVGFLVAGLVWVAATVSTYLEDKETLGELRYMDSVQKESIDNLLQEREVTSRVLEEREQQRAINDATSKQTTTKIHEATSAEYDIDRPLPDSLTRPLVMQYQAITSHCEGGKDATACGLDDGASHTGAAQGSDRPKSGPVVQ